MRQKRKGYRRPDDNRVMVEIKPHLYVNIVAALKLGLITESEEIDVETK